MARAFSGRVLVLAIVLLVPALIGAPGGLAQYQQVREWEDEVTSRSVTVLVPAVGERPDGSLFGVTMELQATIRDGEGGVFVDTRPLTQLDMQGSSRLAAATAAGMSGERFDRYDFFIKVRSPAPTVGGPSAGAAMTSAFVALLLDLQVRSDVVMTGMINPDGSVGPVGGILQKAEAAERAGASVFLIPEGQRIIRHVEQTVVTEDGVQRVVPQERLIDVVEHAREEWGLTVREASDVYETVRELTEFEVDRPEPPQVARSPVFDQVMGDAARAHLERADARLADTEAALNASGLAASQPDLHAQLEEILSTARSRLDLAHAAYDSGQPYTASSRAFQAGVETGRAAIWIEALAAPEAGTYLETRIATAAEATTEARERASDRDPEGVSELEAVGAAQVRAMEATRLLDQAGAALSAGRLGDAVQALAFAEERQESVAWWLDMAQALEGRVNDVSIEADLSSLAREYRSVAREALTYAEVLSAQSGAGGSQGQLLERSGSFLEDARAAQEAGLVIGALYLAVESQVAAHAALSLLGSEALIEERMERQASNARIALDRAREAGVEPFLAASFYEFAPALESQDAVSALLMYGNAASIAALSHALATGESCPFAVVLCVSETPALQRVAFGGPEPWTAYFALATILLGFMGGILVTLVVQQARTRTIVRPGHVAPPGLPAKTPSSRRGVAAGTTAAWATGNGDGVGAPAVWPRRAMRPAAAPRIVAVPRRMPPAGSGRRN